MKKHPKADEKRKNLWPALPFFVKSGYNTSIKYNKKNGRAYGTEEGRGPERQREDRTAGLPVTAGAYTGAAGAYPDRDPAADAGKRTGRGGGEPNPASEQMQLRALRTADGASWWYAFTSFEEEMKGAEAVQSTFLVELEKLLDAALQVPEIQGIILNPWNRTIQLDKTLLRIIKG